MQISLIWTIFSPRIMNTNYVSYVPLFNILGPQLVRHFHLFWQQNDSLKWIVFTRNFSSSLKCVIVSKILSTTTQPFPNICTFLFNLDLMSLYVGFINMWYCPVLCLSFDFYFKMKIFRGLSVEDRELFLSKFSFLEFLTFMWKERRPCG